MAELHPRPFPTLETTDFLQHGEAADGPMAAFGLAVWRGAPLHLCQGVLQAGQGVVPLPLVPLLVLQGR